jgi:large subunit ribosomal protein L21
MKSYAIVHASGKQFWVEEDRFYDFDRLPLQRGEIFKLNKILLVRRQKTTSIGQPFLDENYIVEGKVLRHLSGSKVRVYKMRPKKKTRKTYGSRNKLTRVYITRIVKKSSSICYL